MNESVCKGNTLNAVLFLFCSMLLPVLVGAQVDADQVKIINPVNLKDVKIQDGFWLPKLKVWDTKTVYDVLDKLEGKYIPDRKDIIEEKQKLGRTTNAFLNFDRVAQKQKDTKIHDGPPWYDGLVYETIKGASDLLATYPDARLEKKIDAYIVRIAAAQAADSTGYLNTYTTLMESNRHWGMNGGDDKWQHDIYNSGMLIEAAVHYYQATGKTKLLNVAVKLSNYIYNEIGPASTNNVIPGHGGSEEAMMKLYWLFKTNSKLKSRMTVPVNEDHYFAMSKLWIENRGNYKIKNTGLLRRNDSSYNQDHLPVFEQETIEGHAVRATLLATGVTSVAIENKDARYVKTANAYWNNMIGKRMFITGGEGAVADGERFGADYYLPESAYLETCASIGAGFFSQRMNQLKADGKYMDELERIIYNNLLSGISLAGDHYFYENPLKATNHIRWSWHGCPCCPPMFLKMIAVLPSFIYASSANAVYVNLFIGSEAKIKIKNNVAVNIKQVTNYPWNGKSVIKVNPSASSVFTVYVRIPGWSHGVENPFDLYRSSNPSPVCISVNKQTLNVLPVNGYAAINRQWKTGDVIELNLPVQPRMVFPNDAIASIKNKIAIAAGPVVYGLENTDNPELDNLSFNTTTSFSVSYKPELLNGINIINGTAINSKSEKIKFIAIPFYAFNNRGESSYIVWLPVLKTP
jgi:DUF1680 family protein